jgi:hypothetical protein
VLDFSPDGAADLRHQFGGGVPPVPNCRTAGREIDAGAVRPELVEGVLDHGIQHIAS